MAKTEAIDKAIAAHGLWKARLAKTIELGKTEIPPASVLQDIQCDFGKWLYGNALTPEDKGSSHYKTIRDLHAEFHRTAARVTELALAGRKAEALAMMELGGVYTTVSSKLTRSLLEWRLASR
jgi:methyl-accepting chemotaxis protein